MKEGQQSLTQNNGFVLSCLSGTDLFPLSSSEHGILGILVFFLLSLPEITFSSRCSDAHSVHQVSLTSVPPVQLVAAVFVGTEGL